LELCENLGSIDIPMAKPRGCYARLAPHSEPDRASAIPADLEPQATLCPKIRPAPRLPAKPPTSRPPGSSAETRVPWASNPSTTRHRPWAIHPDSFRDPK